MKYFTIAELCQSETATAKGIDNTPTKDIEDKLLKLVDNVLDPLREKWGSTIIVNSGYRCKELNKIVGGVNTSHHVGGFAADITVGSIENNKKLFKLLIDSNLKWTQAILEKGGIWIHVSYKEDDLKNQILYL